MIRRQFIVGNWKMNGLRAEGSARVRALAERARTDPPSCDVLVCPPATLLADIGALLPEGIALGGQDCAATETGAHTGDIAASMLADLACKFVIVGHSERRADHGETSALVRAKAAAAQAAGLCPIVCVGESLAQRRAGRTRAVVAQQVARSIPERQNGHDLIVAYEPVWAIGTGLTPSRAEIAEVHRAINAQLARRFGAAGKAVRLLYGGSVKPANAAEILAIDHVDGALVGGASLNAADFWSICEASRTRR